jgi:beta-galactosidase
MPIKVRHNGLEIDGNLVPLVSGTMHYWRLDPAKWGEILDRIGELGFSMVETYVPWGVHETAPDEFDFGRKDPALDLDRFLGLVAERGMKAILRPGPCINAELTWYGFPERIIRDPQYWALDAEGAPAYNPALPAQFPVPSYANPKFYQAYEPFLNALAPLVQKHLHPAGPVVALQVENETSYFFRQGTFDLDYSEPSLALFRHFLELKYRTLKALNQAWGGGIKSFGEAQPPRVNQAEDLKGFAPCLDWAEYREYQILWALSQLTEMFRQKGFEQVPLFHNLYSPFETPYNLPELEKDSGLDFCGIDAYQHSSNSGTVLDKARYMALCGRLPYFAEFAAGSWPSFPLITEEDSRSSLLLPFMGGARGVNHYMLVERERWLGSPISSQGELREGRAGMLRSLNDFLKTQEWHLSFPQFQAALLFTREAQLAEAAFQMPGLRLPLAKLGLPEALLGEPQATGFFGGHAAEAKVGPEALRVWLDDARTFLRQSQLTWAPADSGIDPGRLSRLGLVLAACWGFLDEATARRLLAFAENGGLLVLGPQKPLLNQKLEPLKAFEDLALVPGKPLAYGDGKILWAPGAFDAKASQGLLNRSRLRPELSLSDPSLDHALHRLGGRLVLFVRNPHDEPRGCSVFKEGKFVLKPLWAGAKFLGAVEEREVRLEAHETRVWEVIPC